MRGWAIFPYVWSNRMEVVEWEMMRWEMMRWEMMRWESGRWLGP